MVEILFRESVWLIEFQKKQTESSLGVIYLSRSLAHLSVNWTSFFTESHYGRLSLEKASRKCSWSYLSLSISEALTEKR